MRVVLGHSSIKMIISIGFMSLLSACALKPRTEIGKNTGISASNQESAENGSTDTDETPLAEISEKESSSDTVEANVERPYKSAYGVVSMDQNKYVDQWVKYFTGKGRKHMVRYLARSSRYLPMMKNTLRENGLPEELVYVALIESGFSPVAHSHANAVGYWQFIRGTGKRYGLRIDGLIDERRDPVLSTKAAAEYFKALYGIFGDWHLALAGYNAGENRIQRAVTRHYTRDFWKLVEKRRSFARETKHYVPKFIAAAMIAEQPEKYGFTDVEYQDPLSYDTVELKNPISLSRLAQNLNVEVEELKLLNPKFRGDYVPISRGSETVIRLPVGRANDALAAVPLSVSSEPVQVVTNDYFFHRIRRGDNLSMIAKRYRTSVSKLRRLNNLSNRALLRVGSRLRVPDPGGGAIYTAEGEGPRSKVRRIQASLGGTKEVHVVRRGENLTTIARRYGTSVARLLKINNLSKRTTLKVGQKIRIIANSESSKEVRSATRRVASIVRKEAAARKKKSSSKVAKANARANKATRVAAQSIHRVRRGETLLGIARKYNVRLSQLAKANSVKTNHEVRTGYKLVIPE